MRCVAKEITCTMASDCPTGWSCVTERVDIAEPAPNCIEPDCGTGKAAPIPTRSVCLPDYYGGGGDLDIPGTPTKGEDSSGSGNGGSTPVVQGRFEAVAHSAGPDRKPGTKDDWAIGPVPAKWSVEPFNEVAKEDRDAEFAGLMDADTGIFTPAGAGPNPKRRMSTNNAGNLNAVATVTEGKKTLTGKGHFIVTVQRWNNPPLP